jgi:hypothetical protein
MALDPFDRPMPGESLTKPLVDDPSLQEPKIDNLYDAYTSTVDSITDDSKMHSDLISMIDAGVDLESIANILTFGAFSKGMYTPDIAMQLNPHLIIWMYTEAHEMGLKEDDINIVNFSHDKEREPGNMSPDTISMLMSRRNPDKYKNIRKGAASERFVDFFSQLGSSEEAVGSGDGGDSFMDMKKVVSEATADGGEMIPKNTFEDERMGAENG